jgi:hypothetical protein
MLKLKLVSSSVSLERIADPSLHISPRLVQFSRAAGINSNYGTSLFSENMNWQVTKFMTFKT